MIHKLPTGQKGYTLLELMIVVAIVGILVSLAIPHFQHSAMKAKETALRHNLFTMRAILDQYYADRGDYPLNLETLVESHYLRAIPVDPMTKSTTTWEEVYETQEEGDDSPTGVYDVKSGSDEIALDGTPYNDW